MLSVSNLSQFIWHFFQRCNNEKKNTCDQILDYLQNISQYEMLDVSKYSFLSVAVRWSVYLIEFSI